MEEATVGRTGRDVKDVSLRRIEAGDWAVVHSWARLPESCRYQVWGPNTEDETRVFVAVASAAWDVRPQTRYVFLGLAGGRVIGSGEVNVRSAAHRQGEISYGVHPSFWRQGYGTGLARALVAFGFETLGLHRIFGTCDPRNVGSAGVLTKMGFQYEGLMRSTQLIRSGWRDSSLYSLLESEWPRR